MDKIIPVYETAKKEVVQRMAAELLVSKSVPAGEIWVITSIVAYVGKKPVGRVIIEVLHAGSSKHIKLRPSLEKNTTMEFSSVLILEAKDQIYWRFSDCEAGTGLYGTIVGYKYVTE